MRYVRKVTALVLSVIFCAALIIGISVIYSVRNVNVRYEDGTGLYLAEYQKTCNNLKGLKGSGLLFLGEGDIRKLISDDGKIALVSYEKIYPCSVNISLKERVERFAEERGGFYSFYDEDGLLMRKAEKTDDLPINPVDLSPDVLLKFNTVGDDKKPVEEDYLLVAKLLESVNANFGAVRAFARDLEIQTRLQTAVLTTRSGVKIAFADWKNDCEKKAVKAAEVYSSLGDGQRVGGMILVSCSAENGEAVAKYS